MKVFFKQHIIQIGILVFFLAFLIYGLTTVKDYGVSFDEGTERNSSLITYKYVYETLRDKPLTRKTNEVDFSALTPLHEYVDRYYGVALQLPTVLYEHLNEFEMTSQEIYTMRHTYNFLFFFAACIFFYLLLKDVLKNRGWALLGTAMLIISPRILADSFYNNKDLLFLSIFVINMYFACSLLRKPGWMVTLLFGATTALCTNTRIVGALVPLIALLLLFAKSVKEKNFKKTLPYILVAAFLSLGVYIVVSPVLWENPIPEMINTILKFSDYGWGGFVYYLGEWMEGNNTPWHYIPLWILCTTPFTYIVLFVVGVVVLFWHCAKKNMWEPDSSHWKMLLIFLLIFVPFLYFAFMSPTVYNGWRHFYFIYPCMIALAVYGLQALCGLLSAKKYLPLIPIAVLGFSMLFTGGWLVKNHPYGNLYFQPFFREEALKKLEKDYWMMTERECLEWIADNDSRDQVSVSFPCSLGRNFLILDQDTRAKLKLQNLGDYAHSDYLQMRSIMDWTENEVPERQMYEKVYEIDVDGYFISGVYKRIYGVTAENTLMIPENGNPEELIYSLNKSRWTMTAGESGSFVFDGMYDFSQRISRVMLRGSDELLANATIQVSADGSDWVDGELLSDIKWCYTFPEMEASYIRVITNNVPGQELKVELLADAEVADTLFHENSIINIVSAEEQPGLVSFANDNDMATCWYATPPQAEGSYLVVETDNAYDITEIRMPQGEWGMYYPRNLHFMTRVGETEELDEQFYASDDSIRFRFNEAFHADYIKMILGEQTEGFWGSWSVYEIELLGKRK